MAGAAESSQRRTTQNIPRRKAGVPRLRGLSKWVGPSPPGRRSAVVSGFPAELPAPAGRSSASSLEPRASSLSRPAKTDGCPSGARRYATGQRPIRSPPGCLPMSTASLPLGSSLANPTLGAVRIGDRGGGGTGLLRVVQLGTCQSGRVDDPHGDDPIRVQQLPERRGANSGAQDWGFLAGWCC